MRLETGEQLIQIGSHRIRARVAGASDEVPLLLLNGLGAPIEVWHPLLGPLGELTIAFDAPGCGGSTAPRVPLTISGHARVGLDLLDHLGVERAHVLGLSFGGMVAQEIAHLAPARIQRIVLASTSCGWGGVPGTPAAVVAVLTPARFSSAEVFHAVAPQYIGGTESTDAEFLVSQARARAAYPPDAVGYAHQVWAASTWSSRRWLPLVSQPVLVLYGDEDPLVPPANGAMLAELLPDARVHIVRGGGHLCLLERAQQLGPMIKEFLVGPLG